MLAFGILIASLGAASQPSRASAGGLDCSLTVGDGQRAEATALFQQGQQALLASRWSEAEAPLLRAVTLDTAAPLGVTLALGTASFQAGALADAEREFRVVLAADPRSGDAHNNLAVVCMLTDRLEEAERETALAQRAGVEVSPRLKDELRKRKQSAAAERRPPP